jgi:hypothetical protein
MSSSGAERDPKPLMCDAPPAHPRRLLLRAGVLGGGAAALLAAGGVGAAGGAAALAADAPVGSSSQVQNLFTLPDLNFDTLFAFGTIGYGCAEFGELVTAVNQVNAAGASYQTYYDTFRALAQRTGALADRELAAGHLGQRAERLPARDLVLRPVPVLHPRHRRPNPGGRRVCGHAALLATGQPALRPAVRAGPHPLR